MANSKKKYKCSANPRHLYLRMENDERPGRTQEVPPSTVDGRSGGGSAEHSLTSDYWSEYLPSAQRVGGMAAPEESFLHKRMAEAPEALSNELSLAGALPVTRRKYYTCVIRGHERPPINIGCLYVQHEDHIHVVFESPNNISKKVDNLLNDCRVPKDLWLQVRATRQLVRDIYRLLQYFTSRGGIKKVKNHMMEEYFASLNLPPCDNLTGVYSTER